MSCIYIKLKDIHKYIFIYIYILHISVALSLSSADTNFYTNFHTSTLFMLPHKSDSIHTLD